MPLLNKLFNIRAEEWPRLLLLYAMNFVMLAGIYWGDAIVEAAFLRQVGVEFLPLAIMGNAVCSILSVVIYTAFADRVSNDKLLMVIFAISGGGIAIGLALLGWGWVTIAYPLLYLIVNVPLRDVLNVHWATYVNSFYDTRAAKRIIPVLTTAVRLAGIFAGLTMPVLNNLLTPGGIIFLWLCASVMTIVLTWLMPRILGERTVAPGSQPTPTEAKGSASNFQQTLDNIREGYRYVSQSTFLKWMALATLTTMVLLAFVNYQTGKLMLTELKTVESISNFTGLLNGLSNLIALPFQMFLLSRLIGGLGLGNTALIFPAITMATCGSLALAPNLYSAGAGHLTRTTFRTTLRNPIDSLMYNAVPLRVKGRARAFIGGLVVPLGSLIGGALLLLPQYIKGFPNGLLLGFIGLLAAGYLASSWIIRRQYAQALIAMLEQEDFSFLLSQEASEVIVADPATLAKLQKKLEESSSHELTVFIAQLISQVGGSKAIPILGAVAKAAADARTRSAIIDVLVAADLQDEAVRQLYIDFLADPDGQVRQSAIGGLEQLASATDPQFLAMMSDMVQDADLDVCVRALTALARSGNFYQHPTAVQVLDQLLAEENTHRRAKGANVLGQIGNERAILKLAEYLPDSADQVRLEAALAVEALSKGAWPAQATSPIVDGMRRLLHDPIERVRQAALIVLGRLGARESHQAIVEALVDASPQVRATAADALVQAGKSIIPVIHPKLNSGDPQLRKMTAVILSRVNPREFGPLIVGTHVTGNLLTIYRNHGLVAALGECNQCPSIGVLQSYLREQGQQLADEIFYLLTAIHDPDSLNIISESLRSETPRVRANAAEALESLTTPQVANLIAPLFEPDLPPAQLLALSQDTWDMEHPNASQAFRLLAANPDDPWLRAMTAFALGELGASLAPKQQASTEPPPPAKEESSGQGRRARRSSADLLGALMGDSQMDDSAGKPAEKKPRRSPLDALGGVADSTMRASAAEVQAAVKQDARPLPFTLPEIEGLLAASLADHAEQVRRAAEAAKRVMAGLGAIGRAKETKEEGILLSTIEKIIFLKEVPFFQGMTIDQLKVLASVCEEELFEKDTHIFNPGDAGGVLYVVVSGRVGIEQEKRTGSFARLADIEAHSYFGEANFFDNSTRTTSAVAIQDTLALRLRREPLIALARQHPDMSLELINVLSQRLRDANDRIADLTRTRPRELHKLFDQFA